MHVAVLEPQHAAIYFFFKEFMQHVMSCGVRLSFLKDWSSNGHRAQRVAQTFLIFIKADEATCHGSKTETYCV